MPLSVGDKLGPCEILAPIGAGGMGEVYRARDTQLEREVAIKVLPHALAGDPERLARFDREARILAALNHPNIAVIYGLAESPGQPGKIPHAIVMELVAGETLGAVLRRGPLSVKEACKTARQIAAALEAAHDKGVVHRDLKPGNVMLTPAGLVKVLDFGLAAMAPVEPATPGDPQNSPTLTMGGTIAGTILGTASYMSPEQAEGLPVDKRADVWSFGVLLWEMLTGKRLFEGKSVSRTLADVLRMEIDFSKISAPAAIRNLLQRCLDRDTDTRLRDIREARVVLDNVIAGVGQAISPAVPAVPSRSRLGLVAWATAAVLAVALGVALWALHRATQPIDRPLTRLSVDLGPDAVRGARLTAAISPDGTRIVFTGRAEGGGGRQLFTRRLDQPEAMPLAGTAGSNTAYPFFSPDGEWIGFFSGDRIGKVAAQGGSAVALGDVPKNAVSAASWGEDGNIIFGSTTGLMRMPEAGGVAQPVKGSAGLQIFPQVLPGAGAVLFNTQVLPGAGAVLFNSGVITATALGLNPLEALDIDVLQFDTGKRKTLLHGGYWPRYLATSGETGHLVYVHEGTLFGVAFDPKRLEIHGTPTPLLEDLAASGNVNGGGQFAFSETGTFVYLSGRVSSDTYPILALDASGKIAPLVAQTGVYGRPRFSPDGKRLAYTAAGSKGVDVWVDDLERDTSTQLTFTGRAPTELAWAPDSRHLVFGDGGASLWWIRADGSSQPQQLLAMDKSSHLRPFSFSPDGRLAFAPDVGGLPDIWTLPLDLSDPEHPRPGKAEPFLADPKVVEVDPAFSPDGKFLAYASSESGVEEVFVRSFPGPGGKWKISTAGGKFPVWSRTARDLLFLGGDDRIMVVNYTIEKGSFSAGKPQAWSPTQVRRTSTAQNFDLAPDGKRVAIFPRPAAEQAQSSLHATFLLNFFDEVRRRVPANK